MKEYKKSAKSGSGTDDVKKWKYFQSLLFLHAFTVQNVTNTLSNFVHEPVGKSRYIYVIIVHAVKQHIALRSCIYISSTSMLTFLFLLSSEIPVPVSLTEIYRIPIYIIAILHKVQESLANAR